MTTLYWKLRENWWAGSPDPECAAGDHLVSVYLPDTAGMDSPSLTWWIGGNNQIGFEQSFPIGTDIEDLKKFCELQVQLGEWK